MFESVSVHDIYGKPNFGETNEICEQQAVSIADETMCIPKNQIPPTQQKCKDYEDEELQMQPLNVYKVPIIRKPTAPNIIQKVPLPRTGSQHPSPQVSQPRTRHGLIARTRPTGDISRADFDNYLQTNFGVSNVHTGTQAEQETRSTRRGVPAVTIPNWQSWDPGTSSEDYSSIINGIEDMIDSLGAMPNLQEVVFFRMDYEPDPNTGVGIPKPNTGAAFGAGHLTIYSAYTGSTRPAISINRQGGPQIAPVNRDNDIRQTIIHELGHGVAEAAMASQNNQTFVLFKAAVGWIGSPPVLYDMGQPTVRAAITNNSALPAAHIITPNRWSDHNVSEQPISRYAVDQPSEDFAESIAAYIQTPSVLQQRSPRRYDFIHNNIGTWKSSMNPIIRARTPLPIGDFPVPSDQERNA